MTTPNIEELIARNDGQRRNANAKPDVFLYADNITALQSQAERIAELEANLRVAQMSTVDKCAEIYTLRAQLADAELHTKQVERGLDKALAQLEKIAATEPSMIYHGRCVIDCGDSGHHNVTMLKMIARETKLFTHPMPAQDVTELVELLEFMWRDVSMNEYAFEKLEAALSKYKGAK